MNAPNTHVELDVDADPPIGAGPAMQHGTPAVTDGDPFHWPVCPETSGKLMQQKQPFLPAGLTSVFFIESPEALEIIDCIVERLARLDRRFQPTAHFHATVQGICHAPLERNTSYRSMVHDAGRAAVSRTAQETAKFEATFNTVRPGSTGSSYDGTVIAVPDFETTGRLKEVASRVRERFKFEMLSSGRDPVPPELKPAADQGAHATMGYFNCSDFLPDPEFKEVFEELQADQFTFRAQFTELCYVAFRRRNFGAPGGNGAMFNSIERFPLGGSAGA